MSSKDVEKKKKNKVSYSQRKKFNYYGKTRKPINLLSAYHNFRVKWKFVFILIKIEKRKRKKLCILMSAFVNIELTLCLIILRSSLDVLWLIILLIILFLKKKYVATKVLVIEILKTAFKYWGDFIYSLIHLAVTFIFILSSNADKWMANLLSFASRH